MPIRYIGIDAHQESCTLAAVGPSGRRGKKLVVETTALAIREALKSITGDRFVCLEEGEFSEWLYEIVEPLARGVVVVQPGKAQGNKSDLVDAWARADELRRGDIKQPIFKPGGRLRSLREAVRAQHMAVGDVVRTKNRLRGVFRSRGVHAVASELYRASTREPWFAQLPEGVRFRAELLARHLDAVVDTHQQAEKWLLREGAKIPAVKLLTTAPGIGPIRAAQIVAVVVNPHRFRTSRQFWSYCGLGIVTHSSSDWIKDPRHGWVRKEMPQTRGLNRNRNPMMKNAFKGAAMTVIQTLPDSPLSEHYTRLIEQTKPNLARLTIARRIAATTLAMWKNKEVYDPSKQNRAQHR